MNLKKDEGSLALGTKKFQEKTKRWKVTELQKKFIIENLVDKKNFILNPKLVSVRKSEQFCLKNKNCNLVKNSIHLFTKDFFEYNKCKKCSLIYVKKVIREEKLIKIYKNSKYSNSWGKILSNSTETKFNYYKFKAAVKDLNKFVNKGKILDVGCATGQFLDVCRENDWITHGIELNKFERDIAKKKGHKIFSKEIENDYLPKNYYDAIAILETLEHVYSPNAVINSIYKTLKPNGYLLIIVPNVESLAARIMQARCNMFLGMSHITMYSLNTLKKFLKTHNFKQVLSKTITSEYNIINNYLSMNDPYLSETGNKNFLLKGLTPNKILKKNLGYKIKAIFKKN